ncbi:hypothetical protein [Rhizobium sp. IBUN]|uniref:hypothetical protein n=1 Tax=Rhizobium sp. IBUN TaxID=1042326 RepID=UPI001FD88422|nr:hypothetical protein [Rhizobium sp. IBUN]
MDKAKMSTLVHCMATVVFFTAGLVLLLCESFFTVKKISRKIESKGKSMHDRWLGTSPGVLIPRLQALLSDIERLSSPGGFAGPDDAVIIRNCMLAQRSVPCLIGKMSGHPHIKEGDPAATSELFFFDQKRRFARTLSRWYRFEDGLI